MFVRKLLNRTSDASHACWANENTVHHGHLRSNTCAYFTWQTCFRGSGITVVYTSSAQIFSSQCCDDVMWHLVPINTVLQLKQVNLHSLPHLTSCHDATLLNEDYVLSWLENRASIAFPPLLLPLPSSHTIMVCNLLPLHQVCMSAICPVWQGRSGRSDWDINPHLDLITLQAGWLMGLWWDLPVSDRLHHRSFLYLPPISAALPFASVGILSVVWLWLTSWNVN